MPGFAETVARQARAAGNVLKTLTNEQRTQVLYKIHDALKLREDEIRKANLADLEAAKESNLAESLVQRLDLFKGDKFTSMLHGILDVANLEDPVGKVLMTRELDNDLNLYKITAPVGVILVVFESRPEVIANITALCIKSGNAGILKGGKESTNTFREMAMIIKETIGETQMSTSIPINAVQLVESRQEVSDLLSQDEYIDLVIPRGSNSLVRKIKESTKIPVLGHADGICSIYVDDDANLEMVKRVVLDSKTNYCAACNAVETLLINRNFAGWRDVLTHLATEGGVTLHVTSDVKESYLKGLRDDSIKAKVIDVQAGDFDKEFLSLDIAVKFVSNVQDAVEHINIHSSKHTDAIITENEERANYFLKAVDSAGVYWNASTRFADGFRYGFGTEVGISTAKIHARGPVGLDGLVTYQYQVKGKGQIASDYLGAGGKRPFIHKDLDI